MIISVHIPKCGGISFEHVLRDIFGRDLWRHYEADPERRGSHPGSIPSGTRCIHGHFRSDSFEEWVPQPDLVTWLRHPVERVASNYFHFIRHPDPENRCCRELMERKLSLERFAELEGMRNLATRYLAGKPASAFKFIGITERFADSLVLFGRVFGFRVPRRPPRENRNPERNHESYDLPHRLYQRILALNAADLASYQAAARWLDELMPPTAAHGWTAKVRSAISSSSV